MSPKSPTPPEFVEQIAERLKELHNEQVLEDSKTNFNSMMHVVRWKDVVMAVSFFGSLCYGAFVVFEEMRDKPTTEDVEMMLIPVQDSVKENRENVIDLKDLMDDLDTKLNRVQKVNDVVLENLTWQAEVLDHVANQRRGKPPAKPDSLKRSERELLQ